MSKHQDEGLFDQPADEETKTRFGMLRIFARRVKLEKGASYIMDDLDIDPDNPDSPLNRLTDNSGNLWEFRGKQPTPGSMTRHVVVVVSCTDRNSEPYNEFQDFMMFKSDACYRVTFPTLEKFFGGHKLPDIWGAGKTAHVHAEVVKFTEAGKGGQDFNRYALRIVKAFKDQAEREAAETAFFSQFQQTGAEVAGEIPGFEDKPMPWGDDGKPVVTAPTDAPVTMSKETALTLLKPLWIASGQDVNKFLAQLAGDGMKVALAAMGGIDAPEIVAVYSPEQDAIPA